MVENQLQNRIVFLDYLRVIACFMVMVVHSCEPFYLGGQGTAIENESNLFWVTILDGLCRSAVPLFMMASSFLLFPVKDSTLTFLKKRIKRVLIPFIIWLLAYSVIAIDDTRVVMLEGDAILSNLKHLLLNFPDPAGHLWFVYMIIGVYIIMPILSPWINQISKKSELYFLFAWLFATTIPFFRQLAICFYGKPEVWGECYWNEFGTFYGISGFVGYLILGHFFRKYLNNLSWKTTLSCAFPLLVVGFAIVGGWFWCQAPKDFPIDAPVDLAILMEVSWNFTTTGVVLMTTGYFLIIQKLIKDGILYKAIILPISKASYGMYLMHIFFLCFFNCLYVSLFESTFVIILMTAISTYISSFVTSWLISKIPIVGKFIVG